MRLLAIFLGLGFVAQAHDIITTAITFNREIVRIIHEKCASCHRPGGSAFSMLTYAEARPWAVAIKEEILRRRMPPWGAIKGFGEFRNDRGLTAEELELFVSWIDGGTPEGNEKDLPEPFKAPKDAAASSMKGALAVAGETKLARAITLDGVLPKTVPANASMKIVAERPDGTVEPLLWLDQYKPEFGHPFLYRKPIALPAGTMIRGIPAGASFSFLLKSR